MSIAAEWGESGTDLAAATSFAPASFIARAVSLCRRPPTAAAAGRRAGGGGGGSGAAAAPAIVSSRAHAGDGSRLRSRDAATQPAHARQSSQPVAPVLLDCVPRSR